MYFIALAVFVMLAGLLHTWTTRGEVGSRYRSLMGAQIAVGATATASYLAILFTFHANYQQVGGSYVPGQGAILISALRYMEWSVTVPLLTIGMLSVCVLTGCTARRS